MKGSKAYCTQGETVQQCSWTCTLIALMEPNQKNTPPTEENQGVRCRKTQTWVSVMNKSFSNMSMFNFFPS